VNVLAATANVEIPLTETAVGVTGNGVSIIGVSIMGGVSMRRASTVSPFTSPHAAIKASNSQARFPIRRL
jgi:hypothetical protein